VANKFGDKIKQLREANHLLQRQVASELDIDTPMLSKIERGDRKAKKEHVLLFVKLYKVEKEVLLTLWLADQVYNLVKDEEMATKALRVAESEFKYKTRRKV
jgi:transcriptional regulator with XRE-family HTH domain